MWYTDGDQVSETQFKFGKKRGSTVFSVATPRAYLNTRACRILLKEVVFRLPTSDIRLKRAGHARERSSLPVDQGVRRDDIAIPTSLSAGAASRGASRGAHVGHPHHRPHQHHPGPRPTHHCWAQGTCKRATHDAMAAG